MFSTTLDAQVALAYECSRILRDRLDLLPLRIDPKAMWAGSRKLKHPSKKGQEHKKGARKTIGLDENAEVTALKESKANRGRGPPHGRRGALHNCFEPAVIDGKSRRERNRRNSKETFRMAGLSPTTLATNTTE